MMHFNYLTFANIRIYNGIEKILNLNTDQNLSDFIK